MTEDEPFLRALLANPDDRVSRLVYADWLDEHADPRTEYLRLFARVTELPHDDASRPELRCRMLELQATLPPWWVAIAGGLRVTKGERTGGSRIEEAMQELGRGKHSTDVDGYSLELHAAATSGLTGSLAYLEQRSKALPSRYDSSYVLVLRDAAGRTAEYKPFVYSTYAEFTVNFFEWYGDVALLIYREKHNTYIVRFGFDGPARSHKVAGCWVLDDREFAFIGYREAEVRRLSIPDLELLSSLSPEEASRRELLPRAPLWWLNG
jgi:uncharacterized protein (TIGR02996 family)